MKTYTVSCLAIEQVTHDTYRLIMQKPPGYTYIPGHSANLRIIEQGLETLSRPFTFISHPDDHVVSIIFKDYAQRDGLSTRLARIQPGQQLELSESFGAISYNGPGIFVAGGVGITPFLAILRDLKKHNTLQANTLLYSNKTRSDIIYETELRALLGDQCIITLTREQADGYHHGRIDQKMLAPYIQDASAQWYICGSGPFNATIRRTLRELKQTVHVMDMG